MATTFGQPPEKKKRRLNDESKGHCIWCKEDKSIKKQPAPNTNESDCDCNEIAHSLKASKCHKIISINNTGDCHSWFSTYKLLRNVEESQSNNFQIDCKNGAIDFNAISFQKNIISALHNHGIIILRNFFSSKDINNARFDILNRYLSKYIDTDTDKDKSKLMKAQRNDTKTKKSPSLLNKAMQIVENTKSVKDILENEKLFKVTSILLQSEHVITTKYKWLRAVAPSKFTGLHFDSMYMGLGCKQMLSIWIPFGRVQPIGGSLIWSYASHKCPKWKKYLESIHYGDPSKLNKDGTKSGWITDNLADYFNANYDFENLSDLQNDSHALNWCTTDFEPGDIAIFGLKLIHQTLRNDTNCYRLSCDTRWQPSCQPIDPRLKACGISTVQLRNQASKHFQEYLQLQMSHDDDSHRIGIAFLITIGCGLSPVIGCCAIFCIKKETVGLIPASLSFSSGSIIYLAFVNLIPESTAQFETSLGDESAALPHLFALLSIIVGIFIQLISLKYFGGHSHNHRIVTEANQEKTQTLEMEVRNEQIDNNFDQNVQSIEEININNNIKTEESELNLSFLSYSVAFAFILHNLPGGMTTFISLYHDMTLGVLVAIGLALHELPAGISISVTAFCATGSIIKPFVLCTIAALVYPFGAFIGWIIVKSATETFIGIFTGILFGTTAGIVLYIAFVELLPIAILEAAKHENKRVYPISVSLIFAGFFIMNVSNILLQSVS